MKAYVVMTDPFEDCECCLVHLVFARSESMARMAAARHLDWLEPEDFPELYACREPEWDGRLADLAGEPLASGDGYLVPSLEALERAGYGDWPCDGGGA